MAEQTKETGRAGNQRGKSIANIVAGRLGATKLRKGVNEYQLDGKRLNIKSTSRENGLIIVYNSVIERIDYVLVILRKDHSHYDLFMLETSSFVEKSKPGTSSKRGIARYLSGAQCRETARHIGIVQIDPAEIGAADFV